MKLSRKREVIVWWVVAVIVVGLLACIAVFVAVAKNIKMTSLPEQAKPSSEASLPPPLPKAYSFPDGGHELFPDYQLVALYGTPGEPALGVLGEQPVGAAVTRVKKLVSEYQPLTTKHILPTFEIIATVASASPTENGDYSREVSITKLQPWVEAAKKDGIYVVLDLQPGRSDFLSQAKEYKPLLEEPNVGLALDPEWRLKPNQFPLRQIGTVDVSEINGVAQWLADLTSTDKLPQKLFLLHQFRLDMITNRDQLDTSHKDLAYAIQMDGQGTQPQKQETWRTIIANPPANVRFGWKNFYKKDSPVLSPSGTMQLKPQPWYVSYQ